MNLSILVVNLNNLEYTKQCVEDIKLQDCDIDITLVDQNSSERGTKEYFNNIINSNLGSIKSIKFIQNLENISLSRIWNEFVEFSESKFICLLNNDVRISPNFASSSIEVLNSDPNIGFVNHVTNNISYKRWYSKLEYKIIDSPYRQGWDPVFKRECYSKIPDNLSFFYGDDYIYSKLYSSGMKGAYILNSPIIHYERSTTIEKGGLRDMSKDYENFHKMDIEYKYLSFVNEFSKWKPEFDKIEFINKEFLTYRNILLAQTPNIVNEFIQILSEFKTIIEIGFNRGGLSLWLNDNKSIDTKLICYDITDKFRKVSLIDNIDFRIKDCYLDESVEEIRNEINRPGRTLVLCDGGDKNLEFSIFSKFLKPDDVIMCHDYSESDEEYLRITNSIGWPTKAESFYTSIRKSIEDNNLLPYRYNEFKGVLWGSFIKHKKENIDLSILICSLTERRNIFLDRLLNKLDHQVEGKNVEILILSDNAKRSIGEKRNNALIMANGRYICFLDDDDMVSDDYVDLILKEIRDWSPDVIVFDAQITFDGINAKLVKYGREFDHCEKSNIYYRRPNHLMVHKKNNITEFFKEVRTGEDDEWASRMLNRIVTQSRIDKILYYYNYKTTTKKYY